MANSEELKQAQRYSKFNIIRLIFALRQIDLLKHEKDSVQQQQITSSSEFATQLAALKAKHQTEHSMQRNWLSAQWK